MSLASSAGSPSGGAGASGFVYESFKNSTPDNAGWMLGGTNYTAHLTAGYTDPTTSGHAGSSDGQGSGWLRLTTADSKGYCGGANGYCPVVGYAYYNVPMTLTHGLVVSFDYACWGGTPYSGTGYGSDGTSFYLFDGSATFSPGGDGGGLGYNAGGVYPGMPGAYAGVGLDEFGSFTGLGFENQGVGIRGSAPNYGLLSNSTRTAGGQLCAESNASRPSVYGTGYQHYVIAITPDLRVTVTAYTPGGTTVLVDRYNLQGAAGMAALPPTLKFGFAASQGGISDVHEIRNVSVSGIGASTAEIMCGCNQSENSGTGVRRYTHNPVTLPTGDFYHSFTDFSIPGRGVPLHFTRTYNSLLAGQNGPLGYGWSSDQTVSLTTDAAGAVTVTQEDGSIVPFSLTAPATYQAPSQVLATLVKNGDGTLTLTRKNQQKLTFTAPTPTTAGLLIAQADRNGYTTSLTYTTPLTTPLLSRVTDAAGRSLTFTYDGANHIKRISDPIGRTTVFTYDTGTGDLISAQDMQGYVTSFTYAPGTHLLQTMTDPNNGTVTNVYDTYGRVTSQSDPLNRTTTFSYAYAPGGPAQAVTITDPRGYVTVDQYQGGELASETTGAGTPQAATWRYTYDPATLGVASVTDPNGHTSYNTYDANGNLLSHTDPLGRVTSYAYDALNDVTAITDPLGLVTTKTYDANGNLLSVARALPATRQSRMRVMSATHRRATIAGRISSPVTAARLGTRRAPMMPSRPAVARSRHRATSPAVTRSIIPGFRVRDRYAPGHLGVNAPPSRPSTAHGHGARTSARHRTPRQSTRSSRGVGRQMPRGGARIAPHRGRAKDGRGILVSWRGHGP